MRISLACLFGLLAVTITGLILAVIAGATWTRSATVPWWWLLFLVPPFLIGAVVGYRLIPEDF